MPRFRPGLLHLLALLLAVGLALPGSALAQSKDEREYDDLALTGDNVCTRCHDDADNPRLMTIGRTKHGTRADARTPTCTSCHGESLAHRENPDGTDVRPLPDRLFKAGRVNNTVADKNAPCLGCHQGGATMFWAASTHDARDVACVDCHQMHTDNDRVRNKATQTDVCANCHAAQRSEENKPYRHPTREGLMACSDCHNPHGSPSMKGMLARDSVVDTCYTCHMEKRG
ncbi:MAG TPA: cytochrome c3 family protein, partial [Gammaproteobacteria bacterium]